MGKINRAEKMFRAVKIPFAIIMMDTGYYVCPNPWNIQALRVVHKLWSSGDYAVSM